MLLNDLCKGPQWLNNSWRVGEFPVCTEAEAELPVNAVARWAL